MDEAEGRPVSPVTHPIRVRGRLLPVLCWAYALGALGYWLLLRYLGDRWWPVTILLYAPRWPWALPLLVLLPAALRRSRWLPWVPLLAGLFIFVTLMDLHLPLRRPNRSDSQGFPLRLLTCNVHRMELNVHDLDRYIRTMHPDIVALQDFSGWDESPGFSGPGWYTFRMSEIFLASRFPIRQVHDFQLESIPGDEFDVTRRTGAAGCFDLQTPAGLLHVIDLHLASPHAALSGFMAEPELAVDRLDANSVRRWEESRRITDWLKSQPGPFIIAGDFNTVAESPIFRRYWSHYPDAFPSVEFGYGYTHFTFLSELRIDHVLGGPGVTFRKVQIGPPCGTPHRPMVVDLVIRTAP